MYDQGKEKLIWVLESAYEISREKIVESISDMLLMPILKFEHQSARHIHVQVRLIEPSYIGTAKYDSISMLKVSGILDILPRPRGRGFR